MVYIPKFNDLPDTCALRRFEKEYDTLNRGRKSRALEDRLTVGQLMNEAGLGNFLLSLDGIQFKQASMKKRREMICAALNLAGMVINQDFGATPQNNAQEASGAPDVKPANRLDYDLVAATKPQQSQAAPIVEKDPEDTGIPLGGDFLP
ncbi:hypothetical protein [Edwardsiella tarda]|uniref:hypothetical protein n=1 Tax=Edwardsiella tarda TaxID=636 RepID=UPI00054D04AE|nr:hypothetical protein [Edwardsiella tarda]